MMTIFNPLRVMMGLAMRIPENRACFPHIVDADADKKSRLFCVYSVELLFATPLPPAIKSSGDKIKITARHHNGDRHQKKLI
jgi:hypothetical protein